ncbi:hypothetical protein HDU76_004404 [Blyttiomyces sp. JEL0837]|nr:hypothetical protein HDU76_004404 [Blyttiomyces sp. JEL0837]
MPSSGSEIIEVELPRRWKRLRRLRSPSNADPSSAYRSSASAYHSTAGGHLQLFSELYATTREHSISPDQPQGLEIPTLPKIFRSTESETDLNKDLDQFQEHQVDEVNGTSQDLDRLNDPSSAASTTTNLLTSSGALLKLQKKKGNVTWKSCPVDVWRGFPGEKESEYLKLRFYPMLVWPVCYGIIVYTALVALQYGQTYSNSPKALAAQPIFDFFGPYLEGAAIFMTTIAIYLIVGFAVFVDPNDPSSKPAVAIMSICTSSIMAYGGLGFRTKTSIIGILILLGLSIYMKSYFDAGTMIVLLGPEVLCFAIAIRAAYLTDVSLRSNYKRDRILQEELTALLETRSKVDSLLSLNLPESAIKRLRENGGNFDSLTTEAAHQGRRGSRATSTQSARLSRNPTTAQNTDGPEPPRLDIGVLFCDVHPLRSASGNGLNINDVAEEVAMINTILEVVETIVDYRGAEVLIAAGLDDGDGTTKSEKPAETLFKIAKEVFEVFLSGNTQFEGGPFDVRAGIHCGPVSCAIVGDLRFAYDIFGDTVNLASRMMTLAPMGSIYMTNDAKNHFNNLPACLQYSGRQYVKGKGLTDIWKYQMGPDPPPEIDLPIYISTDKSSYDHLPKIIEPNRDHSINEAIPETDLEITIGDGATDTETFHPPETMTLQSRIRSIFVDDRRASEVAMNQIRNSKFVEDNQPLGMMPLAAVTPGSTDGSHRDSTKVNFDQPTRTGTMTSTLINPSTDTSSVGLPRVKTLPTKTIKPTAAKVLMSLFRPEDLDPIVFEILELSNGIKSNFVSRGNFTQKAPPSGPGSRNPLKIAIAKVIRRIRNEMVSNDGVSKALSQFINNWTLTFKNPLIESSFRSSVLLSPSQLQFFARFTQEKWRRESYLMELAGMRARELGMLELEKSSIVLKSTYNNRVISILSSNKKAGLVQLTEKGAVLALDIVGFTALSSQLTTHEVVHMLNYLYRRFDDFCVDEKIEKICTIGDAYIAVAGLPTALENPSIAICRVATKMIKAVEEVRLRQLLKLSPVRKVSSKIQVRIGIYSGPVACALIGGQRKLKYDVVGECVDVATRLEQTALYGTIHVSRRTVEEVASAGVFCNHDDDEVTYTLIDISVFYFTSSNAKLGKGKEMAKGDVEEVELNERWDPSADLNFSEPDDVKITSNSPCDIGHGFSTFVDFHNSEGRKPVVLTALCNASLILAAVGFRTSRTLVALTIMIAFTFIVNSSYPFVASFAVAYPVIVTTSCALYVTMTTEVALRSNYKRDRSLHEDLTRLQTAREEMDRILALNLPAAVSRLREHGGDFDSVTTGAFLDPEVSTISGKSSKGHIYMRESAVNQRSVAILFCEVLVDVDGSVLRSIDDRDIKMVAQKVKIMNTIFQMIESVVASHSGELIKNIGMKALIACGLNIGGLSVGRSHIDQAFEIAKDISKSLETLKLRQTDYNDTSVPEDQIQQQHGIFRIRAGIHCGPVSSAIVGDLKFAYDVFGDSVNVASRMMSLANRGYIFFTMEAVSHLSDTTGLQDRGIHSVKGKGFSRIWSYCCSSDLAQADYFLPRVYSQTYGSGTSQEESSPGENHSATNRRQSQSQSSENFIKNWLRVKRETQNNSNSKPDSLTIPEMQRGSTTTFSIATSGNGESSRLSPSEFSSGHSSFDNKPEANVTMGTLRMINESKSIVDTDPKKDEERASTAVRSIGIGSSTHQDLEPHIPISKFKSEDLDVIVKEIMRTLNSNNKEEPSTTSSTDLYEFTSLPSINDATKSSPFYRRWLVHLRRITRPIRNQMVTTSDRMGRIISRFINPWSLTFKNPHIELQYLNSVVLGKSNDVDADIDQTDSDGNQNPFERQHWKSEKRGRIYKLLRIYFIWLITIQFTDLIISAIAWRYNAVPSVSPDDSVSQLGIIIIATAISLELCLVTLVLFTPFLSFLSSVGLQNRRSTVGIESGDCGKNGDEAATVNDNNNNRNIMDTTYQTERRKIHRELIVNLITVLLFTIFATILLMTIHWVFGTMEVEYNPSMSITIMFIWTRFPGTAYHLQILPASTINIIFLLIYIGLRARSLCNEEMTKSAFVLSNTFSPRVISALTRNPSGGLVQITKRGSVLALDIVGFTDLSSKLTAFEVVNMLNNIYAQFDDACLEEKMEKICTIGDAYITVGGLPTTLENPSLSACRTATKMMGIVSLFNLHEELQIPSSKRRIVPTTVKARVGIYTGSVCCALLGGKKKLKYDVVGKSIDVATKLEQTSQAGYIHVCKTTAEFLESVICGGGGGSVHIHHGNTGLSDGNMTEELKSQGSSSSGTGQASSVIVIRDVNPIGMKCDWIDVDIDAKDEAGSWCFVLRPWHGISLGGVDDNAEESFSVSVRRIENSFIPPTRGMHVNVVDVDE